MSTDVATMEAAKVPSPNMMVGRNGMELTSFSEVWRFASCLAKSGLAPKGLELTEQIVIALEMGFELGLPPMAAIQNIAVINGRPMVFGDVPLAVCRASGLFDEKAFVETITKQGNVLTATCTCKRKDGNPITRTFDMEDAKTACLTDKPGPWKQYPKRMLQMRARAWALRDAFADVLRGCKIKEEYEGVIDAAFSTPQQVASEQFAADLAPATKKPKTVEPEEPLDTSNDSTPPVAPENQDAEPADDGPGDGPSEEQVASSVADFLAVTEGCATLGELTLAWNELTGMAPPASVLESCRAIANTRRDQINAMAKRRK
jgi:hypothetical protein